MEFNAENDGVPGELNHIFVGCHQAVYGGTKEVILRSGKSYQVRIPPNTVEGSRLRLKSCGQFGNDVLLVVHSLYSEENSIEKSISLKINCSDTLKEETRKRCKAVLKIIAEDRDTPDLPALALLDFLVGSSKIIDEGFRQRYSIASYNSRLLKIEECLKHGLSGSRLDEVHRCLLRSAYYCVRSGEAATDFHSLDQLDLIVQNSTIHEDLKQFYVQASITSRALAADLFIMELLNSIPGFDGIDKFRYLSAYQALRDGEEVAQKWILIKLDSLVLNSDIPDNCKIIYKLMREPLSQEQMNSKDQASIINAIKKVSDSVKKASGIVPTAAHVATHLGMKAGTGAAFGTFFGGAATNATLAALGGGSVAAGGLGMLGGLTVATGGAALIGAAALLSVASVSQMNAEDKKALGIAAGAGVATSAAAIWTAWAAVSTFGVASTGTAIGTLSGAAAYSAAMAALGGVGMMTGGAAGTGLLREDSSKTPLSQKFRHR
jgi:hypothetical protein